jgi:hypothetical protein
MPGRGEVMSYAYQAAMWCDDCAAAVMQELDGRGVADTGDTNDYPQGADECESDSPDHCDGCGVFLENPLTSDGWEYVRETITADVAAGRYDSVACREWAPFYGYPWRDEGDDE